MRTLFIKYCQHASPLINYMVLMGIMATCLFFNTYWNLFSWLVYMPLGFICWTFMEYMLHRFVFHLAPKNRYIKNMVYYVHGIHHEYAHTTNYVPFLQNIVFYGSGLCVFYIVLGPPAFIFYTGFLVAVMFQVYIHNLEHAGKSRFFKKLQWHHQYHHAHAGVNFGISTRFWDWLLGTLVLRLK